MGVEGDARFVAAAFVDVADRGPTTASVTLLSVARRSGAVSPQRGEWHGAMGVDQPSQRFAISGLANMPVVKMGELPQTCATAGDRQSVVQGKRVSVRVDLGGRRKLNKQKKIIIP